jgi:hypothetical protein
MGLVVVCVLFSDCKGIVNGHYTFNVKLISDNVDFHHEKGWIDFLENDLVKLLAIEKELKH